MLAASVVIAGCGEDSVDTAAQTGPDAGLDGSAGDSGAAGSSVGGSGGDAGEAGADGDAGGSDAGGPCGTWTCSGNDCLDLVQMPGSDDPASAQALADGYFIATESRYAYIRKDLSMLLAWATCRMKEQYPDIAPLGLYDMSQADGETPGTDEGQPRHPPTTFTQGTEFATAYYQTDGDNGMQNICGDGSDESTCGTAGTYNDGFHCTTNDTIVDVPKQASFLKLLAEHPDFKVVGVEESVGPALATSGEAVAYGVGWVCMHLFASWAYALPELPNPCLSATSCNDCCFDENASGEPILTGAVHDCACDAASGCNDECATTLCQSSPLRPDDACMACAGTACLDDINTVCGSNPDCIPLFSCMIDCFMN